MSKVLTRTPGPSTLAARAPWRQFRRMNSLTRLLGFAVLLLLLFLAVAIGAQAWLHRETRRLQAEAGAAMQVRIAQAVALHPRPVADWSETDLRDVGALIGGTVHLVQAPRPPPPPSDRHLSLDYTVPAVAYVTGPGVMAPALRVTFALPPIGQLLLLHTYTLMALLVLAFGLLAVVALVGLVWFRRRDAMGEDSHPPFAAVRSEMHSLEQLAKTSVARGEELVRERDERQRTEQDLQFNRHLLSQALEEKIRLGHDLHDGIIQSLYAAGLTLEAARALIATKPAEADRRLEQTREALNATIRDVRGYISGLTPERLLRSGFKQALASLTDELCAGRDVSCDLRIDDAAVALLTLEQTREVVQIAREAVSNSLRHGDAKTISLRLHMGDQAVCLLVQDDGAGYDSTQRRPGGHGLGNMEARAERLGGSLRVESQPGVGTRIVLTLPVLSAPPS
jgi:signal transduction histidine kinase